MIKYINTGSIIHSINPIVKYLFELVVILAIPFMSFQTYLFLFLILILTVIFSKVGVVYFHKKLKFIIYISLILIIFSFLFEWLTIVSVLLIIFRIYLMFGIIFIVVMTTRLSSLIKFFNFIFSKFLSKDNTRKLTFIILLIIKFIPLLISEVDHLLLSFKTRGIYLSQGSIKKRITFIKLFIISFTEQIDNLIDEFDLVIHAKNIGFNNMDHLNLSQQIKFIDILVIFVLFLVLFI